MYLYVLSSEFSQKIVDIRNNYFIDTKLKLNHYFSVSYYDYNEEVKHVDLRVLKVTWQNYVSVVKFIYRLN